MLSAPHGSRDKLGPWAACQLGLCLLGCLEGAQSTREGAQSTVSASVEITQACSQSCSQARRRLCLALDNNHGWNCSWLMPWPL